MGVQGMQAAAQVSELEVPLHCRVAWLRKNYSYFEDEHRDVLMDKLDALTKTSGKKASSCWMQQSADLRARCQAVIAEQQSTQLHLRLDSILASLLSSGGLMLCQHLPWF